MPFQTLSARLTLDSKGFRGGVDQAQDSLTDFQGKASKIGNRMRGVGQKMALGITAPLIAAGGAAVREASKVEESQAKMSTVFGDLTEDVEAWADAQAEATGLSRHQFQEMATSLGDTFKPMGFGIDQATEMSKEVSSLAGDLASFNNLSVGDSMGKLQSGLVGNHRALRDFGIIINSTNLGERLEEMFGKGMQEASEQEKMLARLALIQEGTADAQGDMERTADSAANKFRAFKASVRDLAVEFGQELLPLASDLLGTITRVVDWFSNLDDRMKRLIVVGAGLAAVLGPVLVGLGVLLTLPVSGTMAAIAAAVAVAAGAFVAFKDDIMPVIQTVTGLSSAAEAAMSDILLSVSPLISLLRDEFGETVAVWVGHFETAFGVLEELWGDHGDAVMSTLGPLIETIKLAVEGLLDALITVVRVGLAILRGDFEGAFDILAGFLDRQMDRFKEAGKNLIKALVNGIKAVAPEAVDAVADIVGEIRDYLPGSDADIGPLSDLTDAGKSLSETFASGMEARTQTVAEASERTAAAASPNASTQTGSRSGGGLSVDDLRKAFREALAAATVSGEFEVRENGLLELVDGRIELQQHQDRQAFQGRNIRPGS